MVNIALEAPKTIPSEVFIKDLNTADICRKQTTEADQVDNGDYQTFRSECPTNLPKPYTPLGIILDIKSKGLSTMQEQVDSACDDDGGGGDDDGDAENDGSQIADDSLTCSRDTHSEGEKPLETLKPVVEIGPINNEIETALNDDKNEEEEEKEEKDKPHEQGDQPQNPPRKKRKRKKKKGRKKATANLPQLREQQKMTTSSEMCTMTTRTTTAVPISRPLSLPLSLSSSPLSLPIRPLSLSPLHDGPGKATVTPPEGLRSLIPMTTLSVINEHETIDEEPSVLDGTDPNSSTNNKENGSETRKSPKLSTLSVILNGNHDSNGNRSVNNCNNNIIKCNDNNYNSNVIKCNDNNNKNNLFKVIISDYDDGINVDYDLGARRVDFTNEGSIDSRLDESCSSLHSLGGLDDSRVFDGPESPGLDGVKAMANRLNLATRRPSYQQWHDRYIGSSGVPRFPDLSPEEEVDEKLTEERKERINSALGWIKNELGQMRAVDHNLATQLLTLRNDINRLKLERSCENHQDLLDDVKDELSERETLSAVSDIPYDMADDNPLKHLGVTRMNISSRRFSMC